MKHYHTIQYFGNIAYWSSIIRCDTLILEKCESYVKQTYRNRNIILGAMGELSLTIPVKAKNNQLVSLVEIDNSKKWQLLHWRSLESAYNNSPFFEYYKDELKCLFEKEYVYLYELCEDTIKVILSLLELKNIILSNSSDFLKESLNTHSSKDYRYKIIPQKRSFDNDNSIIRVTTTKGLNTPYYQTLSSETDDVNRTFIPNLSILDLIFNIGTETKEYLRNIEI